MGQEQYRMKDSSGKMVEKEAPQEAMRAKASLRVRTENNKAYVEGESHVKGNPGRPV